MTISKRELRAMREEVRQGPDRSSLYWWMVDHHAALLAEGKAGRMPWLKLCKRFIAQGLTDGQGKPPTPLRASGTWREATIEVKAAADRAAASPPVPSLPSRQRADWQPPVARILPPSTRRASPPPAANPIPAQEGDEHLPEEVRAKLAAVEGRLAYLDRHIIRPKQKG
jgi:hypothetical protein